MSLGSRIAALTAAVLALALPACGGDEPAASGDSLARAVPAKGTLVYGEVLIDPGEDRAKEIKEALRKVARRDDVLDLLVQKLDESLREEDQRLQFKEDIEPFLGKRVGIFFTSFANEPDGALVAEVEDEGKAEAALEELRTKDTAAELVDGLLVLGTPKGVRAAELAAKGDALADAKDYESALEPLEDDRLGHVWIDVAAALEAVEGFAGAGAGLGPYRDLLREGNARAAAIGFDVDADGVTVDLPGRVETLQKLGLLAPGQDSYKVDLIDELPAGSWLVLGVGDVAGSAKAAFEKPQAMGLTPAQLEEARRIVREATGLTLDAELFAPIDELALFASGTSFFSISGGVLFQSNDPEQLLSTLRKLADGVGAPTKDTKGGGFEVQIPDTPVQLAVGREGDRVAIGIGRAGVDRLLSPDDTLGDDKAYRAALEDLGDDFDPYVFVLIAPLLEVVRNFVADDPDLRSAEPYVRAFEHVTFGARKDGDKLINRLVVGLK